MTTFGLDVAALRGQRRVLIRHCVDWSEQRPHLAGSLGAALLLRLLDLGWVRRAPANRALQVTTSGLVGLRAQLGVTVDGEWHSSNGRLAAKSGPMR